MAERKVTLSLCMIVHNAERSLPQALVSVQPFADEMIVIDTGSVDGTCEVARQWVARLFEFTWCEDFSAARNDSLEQALIDWILWMDAVDVLPPDSGQELRRLIADCPGHNAAFWVNVEEQVPRKAGGLPRVMAHAHVKLFPRLPQIWFRYHEQVATAIHGLQEQPDDPVVWLCVGTTYPFLPRGLPQTIEFLRRSVAA